jgi:Rieske Fe-S protein
MRPIDEVFRCDRRAALRLLLALPALERARAQDLRGGTEFRLLREPVEVATPAEVWAAEPFRAWLPLTDADGLSGPELLLNGALVRLPDAPARPPLAAFCTLCPHEICEIGYPATTSDAGTAFPGGAPSDRPLFFCVCHSSAFDPLENGDRIGGPAPRGLFRFEFEIRADSVYITAVEAAILARLRELQ